MMNLFFIIQILTIFSGNVFSSTISNCLKNTFEEIKQQGPIRLIVKDRKFVLNVDNSKIAGVLQSADLSRGAKWYSNLGNDIIQFFPRKVTKKIYGSAYDFKPIAAAVYNIERLIFGVNREFTYPIKIGAGILTSGYFFSMAENTLSKYEKEKKIKQSEWLIENDYRFKEIKYQLENKKITHIEAIRKAQDLLVAHELYFKTLEKFKENNVSYNDPIVHDFLLNDPEAVKITGILFKRIWMYQSPEFKMDTNFHFTRKSKPSVEENLKLIKITQEKIFLMASADALLTNSTDKLKKIKDDPYIKKIINLYEQGKLEKNSALNLILKDIDWQARFAEWEVLGASPLKDIQTKTILTLEDIRSESIR